MRFFRNIYLHRRLFILLVLNAILFVMAHFYPDFLIAGKGLLVLILGLAVIDTVILFYASRITVTRQLSAILSNGDQNQCKLIVRNAYPFMATCSIYEEIPYQLALDELRLTRSLKSRSTEEITYILEPKERGEYDFGNTVVMARSPLQLISRRYVALTAQTTAVYPSFTNLNRYSLQNLRKFSDQGGNHRVRRIGVSTEFEQIKEYVEGDDFRHINWKASAKKSSLMVNQYTEEKAQDIYCVIDTGRVMKMPFNEMTLLDYSINASLAVSQVIVQNQDRAGLIYFNKKVDKALPPSRNIRQVHRINGLLYNLNTEYNDSDFEALYAHLKFRVNHRSLILLFTNFEDRNSLMRQLPYLKGIAKNNVLVVVLFKNNEVESLVQQQARNTDDFFVKAVAEKQSYLKKWMVKELRSHGVISILTRPEDLTLNVIDTYLSIKSRGLI